RRFQRAERGAEGASRGAVCESLRRGAALSQGSVLRTDTGSPGPAGPAALGDVSPRAYAIASSRLIPAPDLHAPVAPLPCLAAARRLLISRWNGEDGTTAICFRSPSAAPPSRRARLSSSCATATAASDS